MDEKEPGEVCLIGLGAREHSDNKLQEELMKSSEVVNQEVITLVTPPAPLTPPAPPDDRVLKAKAQKLTSYAFIADIEGLLFIEPP